MHDEGYIKFQAKWTPTPAFPESDIRALNQWRDQMYQHHLIGAYPDGIGFGNISQRYRQNQFLISGSATGNFAQLGPEHFALVSHFDIERNEVTCRGPIIASSESMSHATVYQECPEVQAVIHVHHLGLWEQWKNRLPTTRASATYGSPEMAKEIRRLLRESTVRRQEKIFVMAGHIEGLIAFGESLEAAGKVILRYWADYH